MNVDVRRSPGVPSRTGLVYDGGGRHGSSVFDWDGGLTPESPVGPARLLFLGSIKWLESSPFDGHDLAALHKHRAAVTDDIVPLVVVSRSGVACSGLNAAFGPEDLLRAWRPR